LAAALHLHICDRQYLGVQLARDALRLAVPAIAQAWSAICGIWSLAEVWLRVWLRVPAHNVLHIARQQLRLAAIDALVFCVRKQAEPSRTVFMFIFGDRSDGGVASAAAYLAIESAKSPLCVGQARRSAYCEEDDEMNVIEGSFRNEAVLTPPAANEAIPPTRRPHADELQTQS
jgi:hypothetical protein